MRKFLDFFMPIFLGLLSAIGFMFVISAVVDGIEIEDPVKCETTCQDASRENLKQWDGIFWWKPSECRERCDCGPLEDCCECKPEEFPNAICFDDSDTAFTFNAQVEITEGFYRGYQGAVSRHKDGIYRVAVYRYSGSQRLSLELQSPRFLSGVPASALKAISLPDPAPLPVPIPIQPTEETK